MLSFGVVEVVVGVGELAALSSGWLVEPVDVASSGIKVGLDSCPFGSAAGHALLEVGELAAGVVAELVKPLGDRTAPRSDPRAPRRGGAGLALFGEASALGDGGDVGPVNGEDPFQDVAGF